MLFNRKELFRRVAIVGTGFMGASLGKAIKKKGLARCVVGIGHRGPSIQEAQKAGAIDEGTLDFHKGIVGADLIVLATPVNTILEFIEILGKEHRRGCIVTDIGSTKAMIVDRAQKVLPHSVLFVGSHPLVGSEKKGPASAQDALYEGGLVLMTPTDKTNRLARDKIKQFWTILGASVKFIPPVDHDQIIGYISHLPHVAAFALMEVIPDEYLPYATQGLKDTTRIAASDAAVWKDITLTNPKVILKALDETVKGLSQMRKAIVSRDEEALIDIFKRSKAKREALDKSHAP